MKKKEQKRIAYKIAKLLNKSNPRPDVIDSLEILRTLENAFLEQLKDNLKKG